MSKPKPTKQDETVDNFLQFIRDYFDEPTAKPKMTVAREAGISRVYLHDLIEGNKTDPSLAVSIRIARAMGTTLEKILRDSVIHS
ncbi:MAG: helix-turn-helix transcriptional regulator [Planctomycetaceae bacterium]